MADTYQGARNPIDFSGQNGPSQFGQQSGLNDVVTQLNAGNQILSAILQILTANFPKSISTFTMAAAATKVVTDTKCATSSAVILIPTNAAAGTLMGSAKCLYVTPASGSFTVATASGVAAAGTETFSYVIYNPS